MAKRPDSTELDWTQAVKEQLVELWDAGITTAEIARRLGTTKNSVVGKAHRLFLKPRPSPIRRAYGPQREPKLVTPKLVTFPELPPVVEVVPPPPPKPVFVAPKRVEVDVVRPAAPGERHCQWLHGSPSNLNYCQNAVGREPYCADHRALVYVKRRDKVAAF